MVEIVLGPERKTEETMKKETIEVVCKGCGKTHKVKPEDIYKDYDSLIPAYYFLCSNCSHDNKISLKGASKAFKRKVKQYNRPYLG